MRNNLFMHAILMVKRTLRNYALLSVTIVFSFSILLGYLTYVDANLYNKYKEVFATPREVIRAYQWGDEVHAFNAWLKRLDTIPDTEYYTYFETNTELIGYDNICVTISFLPVGNLPVYLEDRNFPIGNDEIVLSVTPEKLVSEKQDFSLKKDEAIINESLFNAIAPEGSSLPISIRIPILPKGSTVPVLRELQVVGLCADDEHGGNELVLTETGTVSGFGEIYASQLLLSELEVELGRYSTVALVITDNPEMVYAASEPSKYVVSCVFLAQNKALEVIRAQKSVKGIIAVVLLVLLSINLYSSFANALNERKFEIGVKRALGAPARSIVFQFLWKQCLSWS
ncbi:MAG: FtsX-like permease family protein [Bacillota bacterium]